MLKQILASWNPNKYNSLRELSVPRVLKLAALTALCAIAIFIILILPNIFQADAIVQQLSKTTNITISADMQQSVGTYILKNPDIVITTQPTDAFITITPESFTIKEFIFFGAKSYNWKAFSNLASFPAQDILVPVIFFLIPSLLFWGALALLVHCFIWVLLYTLIAYFILHAKNFHVLYSDLWKVSSYASLPCMMLVAATPILRLGLPLWMIWGVVFVSWLVLSLLGTALFAEKHHKKTEFKSKAEHHERL